MPKKERDEASKSLFYVKDAIDALINESQGRAYSDFYPYRYFASEGFLPGYNFPRLPLRAQVRSRHDGAVEYLQRERFLALSEFGPGSLIYHEGAKFRVVGVKNMGHDDREPSFIKFKICSHCGWLETDAAFDLCSRCGEKLPPAYQNLLKMPDADTRRVERINSSDEVRLREGFELVRAFRHEGRELPKTALAKDGSGQPLARLEYYQAARQYLLNLGRKRSSGSGRRGFNIDITSGRWEDWAGKKTEGKTPKIRTVTPFVTASRNCLLFTSQEKLEEPTLLSLKEALKLGIQQCYQLEDDELSATALPSTGEPVSILFVEESEGGAGVLRNLAENPDALAEVARAALETCHFGPTGDDRGCAPGASEKCVAACYDCLMSYYNQPIHDSLDRHLIRDILLALTDARTELPEDEPDKLEKLLQACESPLEREWLNYLAAKNLRLPDEAQYFLAECETRPDFYYKNPPVAIYIDGHWHDYPNRRNRDENQMECLKRIGIRVLRFSGESQWGETIRENGKLFGL